MKAPQGTKGITEAKRLAKKGYPLAATRHLWRANQPVLSLREARDIVEGWGFATATERTVVSVVSP